MFDLYTKFLMDVIAPKREEDQLSGLPSDIRDYNSHLLMVYEKADTMGCLTEDLACEYVSLYLQLGRLDEARNLAGKLCSGKLSNSMKLWLFRASVEIRCFSKNIPAPSKADLQSIFELLRSVLTKVSISEAEALWLMVFFYPPVFLPIPAIKLQIVTIMID